MSYDSWKSTDPQDQELGSKPQPGQNGEPDELELALNDILKLEAQVARLKRELNFKDERIAQLELFLQRWVMFGDTK